MLAVLYLLLIGRLLDQCIQGELTLNEDFPSFDDVHVIADLALEGDIGDEAVHRLWIDPRQVPGIGVAVGVSVRHVE